MKKLIAIILTLAMCLYMLSFAAAEETDPAKLLTEGRWVLSFPVEGLGDFGYNFHFYEDVPGYGGVFYAGFASNQMNFAGTWKVEAIEREYTVYMSRQDTEIVSGTAPYTVSFCDWKGNVLDQCAFDGEYLYNTMETIYGMYSAPFAYKHDTDPENSPFAAVYAAEQDVAIMSFVADEDATCTVTIYHNGRYMDLVGMMVEGTWAMEEQEDGTRVYTLTPEDDTDTPAVLTVAADGATAHYVNEDDEEMDMSAASTGPAVSYTMTGVYPFMEGVDAAMTLSMYEDGTCALVADVFGNTATLDSGAWSLGEDGFTFSFTFVKAGEASSELNMETYAPELHYTQAGTDLGDVDVTLALVVE